MSERVGNPEERFFRDAAQDYISRVIKKTCFLHMRKPRWVAAQLISAFALLHR